MRRPGGVVTVTSMSTAFSPDTVADLVEKAGPSLVRIDAGHRFGGTGTVWSADLVVTASHVVERDEPIELGLADGSTAAATLVGRDESTDLALLRVEGKTLAPVTFRGLDGLRVGHFVVAAARPGRTVRATFGIVSTLGDAFQTRHGARIDRWLETDAETPPGYSGGVLLDLEGRALGITNRGLVRHAHLILPHATVQRVVAELSAHGRVRRGYLGVGVHPVRLPSDVASALGGQEMGVLVHAVEPKSHADEAGILIGDVIVSLDGTKIGSPWELASILRDKVDQTTELQILRAGKLEKRTVKT